MLSEGATEGLSEGVGESWLRGSGSGSRSVAAAAAWLAVAGQTWQLTTSVHRDVVAFDSGIRLAMGSISLQCVALLALAMVFSYFNASRLMPLTPGGGEGGGHAA